MAKNNVKKESRRKFIGDLSKASLATGMMATTTKNSGNELKKAFIHHVFFWLKNSDSTEDKAKLIQGLRKLSKVKTIQQFHIGVIAVILCPGLFYLKMVKIKPVIRQIRFISNL